MLLYQNIVAYRLMALILISKISHDYQIDTSLIYVERFI